MNSIKTFLFDAQSCVINNGYTTDYFKLERGTRQWDPLSAYLFILMFEVLLIQVGEDIDIKGYTADDVELKLSCYRDNEISGIVTISASFQCANVLRKTEYTDGLPHSISASLLNEKIDDFSKNMLLKTSKDIWLS